MAKVLSMEIGPSLIRICEADYKQKNPKVYKKAMIETPEGAVRGDVLTVDETLVDAIKAALKENRISSKKVVFVMNSPKIANREVMIPYVKANKVGDIINANASDYFPVDMEQYELGYSIIGTTQDEEGVKQYAVHVLAVPKMITEGYYELAAALGLTVEALDYGGNSVYQIVRTQCDTGVQMLIKIDEKSTMVTILQEGAIVLQRTVSYGIDEAANLLMNSAAYQGSTYLQALDILKEQNCFAEEFALDDDDFLDMDGESSMPSTVIEEVKASLDAMVTGVSRVVDYYNSRNSDAAGIEVAYVTGVGSICKGVCEFLSGALGVRVSELREIEGYKLDKLFKGESVGPYLSCIGATIAPLTFLKSKAEKKKVEIEIKPGSVMAISIVIFGVGILAAAVLAILAYGELSGAQKEQRELQARVDELRPLQEVYQEYLQQLYTHRKLNYLYESTVLPNENLIAFIEEMEEKMPSSLNVQTFIADKEGVTMTLAVKDKKDAAKLIQQFRTFESVANIACSGITDSGAVMSGEQIDAIPMVTFAVEVIYKGSEADPTALTDVQTAGAAEATTETTETTDTTESLVAE